MSDTPRTDEQEHDEACNFDVPWSEFARTLERELAEAKAKLAESEAGAARLRAALEDLKDWMSEDSVSWSGDYDQGLMCGIEDRGYQADGYSGMRYGYDRALERVSERIDGVIESALATDAGKSALEAVRISQEGLRRLEPFAQRLSAEHTVGSALSRLLETFGTGGSEG